MRGEGHGAWVVTHNVMRISGGGKVLELKPSSFVACSVVCRRLRAGCSRLLVVFVICFDSFRLLVQDVVCLKAGGDPEQIVFLVWSHWAEFKHKSSCFAGRHVWWPSAVFRLTVVLSLASLLGSVGPHGVCVSAVILWKGLCPTPLWLLAGEV